MSFAQGPLTTRGRTSAAENLPLTADGLQTANCGHPAQPQNAGMTAARTYLVATLQRVIEGGDVTTDEPDAAIPDPLLLDRAEKEAWEGLSH